MSDDPVLEASSEAILLCSNCGVTSSGVFCSQCGQKHRTPHDLRLRNFFLHVFREFTNLDSKIFRSLKYLLFHPGTLTAEWLAGRERSYAKPLQLFIIVNLIYFVFVHFIPISTFTNPLNVQYSMQVFSPIIRPIVDERVHQSKLTFDEFAKSYDETSAEQAKTLIILMVPMFAGILALLQFRKHRYFVEQLIFSLHFYSYFLFIASFVVIAILLAVRAGVGVLDIPLNHVDWDAWGTYPAGLVCFVYLFKALRRVYHDGWFFAGIKAAALTYSVLLIIFAYRFVLFFTTIYTMQIKG